MLSTACIFNSAHGLPFDAKRRCVLADRSLASSAIRFTANCCPRLLNENNRHIINSKSCLTYMMIVI
jgi:hypothetical protein